MKNLEYKRWDINDMAFITYAIYKGLSQKQIASIFGVSPQSVTQQVAKIKHSESFNKKTQEAINKSQVLEMKVRSGAYPDHRKAWDDKISKITGMTYTYSDPQPEVEKEVAEEKIVEEEKVLPPLLQLTVSTEAVLKIIRVWKGLCD